MGEREKPLVMDRDTHHLTDYPIGNDGRDATRQEFILSVLPPSADEIVALIKFFKQFWNVGWIILKITVRTNDPLPLHELKPAAISAICPAFFSNRMTFRCGRSLCLAQSTWKVLSWLPSPTKRISYFSLSFHTPLEFFQIVEQRSPLRCKRK